MPSSKKGLLNAMPLPDIDYQVGNLIRAGAFASPDHNILSYSPELGSEQSTIVS